MNRRFIIIKRVVFLLLFLISIIILYKANDLKEYNSSQFYEIESIDDFKNIDIEVDNLILNIVPTNNSYIKLSRNTTYRRYDNIEYSSNYVDGTLTIRKYIKEPKNKESKDVIDVEIPATAKLDNITLKANNSEININEVEMKNLNVDSTSYLKLTVNNSTIGDSIINSEELYCSINDTLIKESIEYNLAGGSISNKNVSGSLETITNLNLTTYTNETSRFENTVFKGSSVNINFLLDSSTKYKFLNTFNKSGSDKISADENEATTYYYNDDVKDLKQYVIDCNDNPITKIEAEEKSVVRSEIE